MKVFPKAFDLLSVVSMREECRPKESGHSGGNHPLSPSAAQRVGGGCMGIGRATSTTVWSSQGVEDIVKANLLEFC